VSSLSEVSLSLDEEYELSRTVLMVSSLDLPSKSIRVCTGIMLIMVRVLSFVEMRTRRSYNFCGCLPYSQRSWTICDVSRDLRKVGDCIRASKHREVQVYLLRVCLKMILQHGIRPHIRPLRSYMLPDCETQKDLMAWTSVYGRYSSNVVQFPSGSKLLYMDLGRSLTPLSADARNAVLSGNTISTCETVYPIPRPISLRKSMHPRRSSSFFDGGPVILLNITLIAVVWEDAEVSIFF